MKTLKNEKFKTFKAQPNNDYKSMLLFLIRKSNPKGLTFGDFEKRMELIDSLKKCKDDIKLENEQWKLTQKITVETSMFHGDDVALDENVMRELNTFGKKIKQI